MGNHELAFWCSIVVIVVLFVLLMWVCMRFFDVSDEANVLRNKVYALKRKVRTHDPVYGLTATDHVVKVNENTYITTYLDEDGIEFYIPSNAAGEITLPCKNT